MNAAEPGLAKRLEKAIDLARQAGDAVLRIAKDGIIQSRKDDRTLVTNADHASDAIIRNGIREAFPEDGILTEESGASGPSGNGRVWVVDPLDGTRAFAKQIPGFSVMIGLLEHEKPVLGVVFDPLGGWLYYATVGGGAFAVPPSADAPRRVCVSTRATPSEMPLIVSPGIPEPLLKTFFDQIGLRPGHQINSVGIKVGLLVRQEGDVYFNYHSVNYWDTVAPLLIAKEAGATATMLSGIPFSYDLRSGNTLHSGPSLITNGTCHESLRQQMQSLVAKSGGL